ncbi:MAG: hypothetical protein PQJ59_16905 [Spirochaetales bacterium]|nr:hypothetical protein [Spirochaetales bacterium]
MKHFIISVNIPEATDEQIKEWIEKETGMRDNISMNNPLWVNDLKAESVIEVDIEKWTKELTEAIGEKNDSVSLSEEEDYGIPW